VATGAPYEPGPTVTDDEGSVNGSDGSASTGESSSSEDEQPEQADFQPRPNVQGVSIERDEPLSNDKDELYRLHVRAGHLSFSKIRAMARRGEVPSKLQHYESPMCAACQYGKATRRTLANQAKREWHQGHNNAGRVRLCQPIGVKADRICRSAKREAYLGTVSSGNRICGPSQLTGICAPAEGLFLKGNAEGKACL
jgi:hypothetical protein